jgi:hypothetical protein
MTLRDAYEHVQHRKEQASFDEWPPALVPTVSLVARKVRDQLGTTDPRVIESTMNGMAWVCQMLYEENMDPEEAMDVPMDLSRNVLGTLPPALVERLTLRQAVDLGIGAGFFTGLWMGVLMRDAV